jgi:hypothetical protein
MNDLETAVKKYEDAVKKYEDLEQAVRYFTFQFFITNLLLATLVINELFYS